MYMEQQNELQKNIKDFIEVSKKVKQEQEPIWFEIENCLDGNYYTVYSPKLDKLITSKKDEGKGVKREFNWIRKILKANINALSTNEPTWLIKPKDKTEEAHKEADVASKYLRYFYRKRFLKDKINDLLWYGYARSLGIIEIFEFEEDGNTKIDLRILDPFDCFFDTQRSWEDKRYFVKTFKKSLIDLEETKDDEGKPVYKDLDGLTSSKLAASDVKALLLRQKGESDEHRENKDLEDILCFECYVKESGKIRIITLGGDNMKIIRDDETEKEDFSVELYYPAKKPDSIYCSPELKDLLDLNRAYNRVASFIENYIFTMLWGRYLKRKDTTLETILGQHGQIANYQGASPPVAQPLYPMPSIVLEYINLLKMATEDIGGIHAESIGRKTAPGQSGKAISLLQAADLQNLSTARGNLESCLVKIAEKVLDTLSKQFVSEEFTVDSETYKVIGVASKEELEGVIKLGKFDEIECSIVPATAFSDVQQKQETMDLVQAGVITDKQTILEAFHWGGIKEVLDREKEKAVPPPMPSPAGMPELSPEELLAGAAPPPTPEEMPREIIQ